MAEPKKWYLCLAIEMALPTLLNWCSLCLDTVKVGVGNLFSPGDSSLDNELGSWNCRLQVQKKIISVKYVINYTTGP